MKIMQQHQQAGFYTLMGQTMSGLKNPSQRKRGYEKEETGAKLQGFIEKGTKSSNVPPFGSFSRENY